MAGHWEEKLGDAGCRMGASGISSKRVSQWRWGIGVLSIALCATVVVLGCGKARDPWEGQPGPPRVVASFAPIACFVMNVAGEDAGVLTLATSNGPHHYEPTVDEALKLRRADLFFTGGLGLDDSFVDRLAQSCGNAKVGGPEAAGLVRLGDRMLKSRGLILPSRDHGAADHTEHGEDCGCEQGEWDPHTWTGIPQAVAMVEIIRDELKRVDPARAKDYDRRAAAYIRELRSLLEEGKALVAGKKERDLVTFHDSLRYFAGAFGLNVAGVVQPRPGVDADAATLAELLKLSKEKGVRVLACEPQYRQRGAAESLLGMLKEKGVPDAVMIDLDPLETVNEGDTLDRGWYVRKMRQNLDTLRRTLR